MNARQLLTAFEGWRAQHRDIVLATVYQTAGSTYSKAGAQMLIDPAGDFQGMLSGGCVEGDLAERAAAVLATGIPQAVTFDLGSDADSLWGLGVGCDGLMRIFLQPLRPSNDYEPFASVAKLMTGDSVGALATVIASDDPQVSPGGALLWHAGETHNFGMPKAVREVLLPLLQSVTGVADTRLLRQTSAEGRHEILLACIAPPPRVLVLGGGLDAQPLVRLINELGWRVTVQDHRPAYIEKGDFGGAERVLTVQPAQLPEHLDLASFAAAIVMSHHLQTDLAYLRLLAGTEIPYIGLLGPPARRARLFSDLGGAADALHGRVHGPAGLDIGGRGPAAIAVSIVAEMHQQLAVAQG